MVELNESQKILAWIVDFPLKWGLILGFLLFIIGKPILNVIRRRKENQSKRKYHGW